MKNKKRHQTYDFTSSLRVTDVKVDNVSDRINNFAMLWCEISSRFRFEPNINFTMTLP